MDILNLLAGPVKGLVDSVGGIIDDLSTSDEERAEAKRKLAALARSAEADVRDHAETIAGYQRDVIRAELEQDDRYTKRARPTLVYAGLVALFLNHIVLPWSAHFTGATVPAIDLPAEFWWGWTGVVGAWAVGRSVEKKARINRDEPGRLTRLVTGAAQS